MDRSNESIGKFNIAFRSNVTAERSLDLIPGELLFKMDRMKFDARFIKKRPKVQRLEMLIYQPCSRCKRRYGDPDCRCGTFG